MEMTHFAIPVERLHVMFEKSFATFNELIFTDGLNIGRAKINCVKLQIFAPQAQTGKFFGWRQHYKI